jgi:hypothetical protein
MHTNFEQQVYISHRQDHRQMFLNKYYYQRPNASVNYMIEPYPLCLEDKEVYVPNKVYFAKNQPKFLTIKGPILLTTEIGNLLQIEISKEYFLFNGLF